MRTVLLCLSLAACGHEGPANVAATKVLNGDDATAGTDATPRCDKGQRRLALAPGSEVRWVAVKSDGVPVVGVHPVTGDLVVGSDGSLAAPAMTLGFSAEGALSDLTLRDERLRRIIFRAQDALPFNFVLTGVDAAHLPEAGKGAQMQLTGDLTLAGVTVPVTIPIVLTVHPTGLKVTEGIAGIHLDLRKTLRLGDAVDALMALVSGVELEDDLQLRLNLTLDEVCRA
jgi:hypothetical protein